MRTRRHNDLIEILHAITVDGVTPCHRTNPKLVLLVRVENSIDIKEYYHWSESTFQSQNEIASPSLFFSLFIQDWTPCHYFMTRIAYPGGNGPTQLAIIGIDGLHDKLHRISTNRAKRWCLDVGHRS